MADILLPDATDLESTQLIRAGGTKFVEQIWEHERCDFAPACGGDRKVTKDMTWIATQLAKRNGLLDKYYKALNRGALAAYL